MKKAISSSVVLVFVFAGTLAVACAPKPASIELTPSDLVVNAADESPAIAAKVLDKDGKEVEKAQVTFSSSDTAVAEVDARGVVTVHKSGEAVITAAVGEVQATANVKVALFSKIRVDAAEVALKVGETKPVKAEVLNEAEAPVEATVEWKSDNPEIVTVGAAGELTGVAPGTANVTVQAKSLSSSVAVTVAAAGPAELKLDKPELSIKKDQAEKVAVSGLDAAGKPVENLQLVWKSADEKIATVTPEGEIKGVAKGEVDVTATAGDKSVVVKVKVK